MVEKMKLKQTLPVFILAFFVLSACRPSSTEPVTLRLALLPVLDTLPVHVALEEGYFDEEGVNVEIVPVASAPERDQLISAGKADGMLNEIVSTLFYNQDEIQVQVVRVARSASPEAPLFRILASAESGITTVEGIKGVKIGISEGTVIEYVADRLLQAEGFEEFEIATIAVPKIPDRLALLGSGEIKAAVLPDPLSSLAIQNGASVIIDDSSHPEYGLSVFSFRTEVIEDHPESVEGFLAAVERAVQEINQNPDQYADLLTEKELVPPPVVGEYQVQDFPIASVPTESQWEDALAWAQEEGLIDNSVPYRESVNESFLP